MHAAEGLVLALRYFMFTQVYFHKTRIAFNHHLQRARGVAPGGCFPSSGMMASSRSQPRERHGRRLQIGTIFGKFITRLRPHGRDTPPGTYPR